MNCVEVLLINLPSNSVREPEEHCGLGMLHSFLTINGVNCTILDSYALNYNLKITIKEIKNWIDKCEDARCIVGISPFVTSHDAFTFVGEKIRSYSNSVEIIAGGHYASLNKEILLDRFKWLDAIIVGEGEESLLEYTCKDKGYFVKGVFDRVNTFIPRDRIKNLDDLPFQSRYLTPDQLNGQPFSISTSRGCYANCSFCSISSFYKLNSYEIKSTYRSAKSVADEIKMLVERFGIKNLKIIDDNFFRLDDNDFLKELVHELEMIDISFRLSARPNDITEERGNLLKKLKVRVLAIGVESMHEESLKLFNKGISVYDSINAIRILNKNNITCLVNFIMFTPIIDLDNLKINLDFIINNIDECIFHRINSHLWLRSTDEIVERLSNMGLCNKKGFPYVEYKYKYSIIKEIKDLFDLWCEPTMNEYYKNADVLMALGIDNKDIYNEYRKLMMSDIRILKMLIKFADDGCLEPNGRKYIDEQLKHIVI